MTCERTCKAAQVFSQQQGTVGYVRVTASLTKYFANFMQLKTFNITVLILNLHFFITNRENLLAFFVCLEKKKLI